MNYVVYVIEDDNRKLYKGVTNNLSRRLKEHERGHTQTTRKMSKLRVIYTEELPSWADARKRELYLKSAAGRKFLKKVMLG